MLLKILLHKTYIILNQSSATAFPNWRQININCLDNEFQFQINLDANNTINQSVIIYMGNNVATENFHINCFVDITIKTRLLIDFRSRRQ